MKKKIATTLLFVLLINNLFLYKQVKCTVVGTEVVIEVGTVLYYIIQGVITGVEVKTIVENISGVETYKVYRKSNNSSDTLYKFVNSNNTRIKPQVAQALVDGLTDKQLVELANNVTVNEEGMMNTGDISTSTKKAVNGIMVQIGGVPRYENYYTELVTHRKALSQEQLNSIDSILKRFKLQGDIGYQENIYQFPYYAISPTLNTSTGETGYSITFSQYPMIYLHTGESYVLYTFDQIGNTSMSPYWGTRRYGDVTGAFQFYSQNAFFVNNYTGLADKVQSSVFLDNNVHVVGHGVIEMDLETFNTATKNMTLKLNYEQQKAVSTSQVYEFPYDLQTCSKIKEYIGYDKENILIKDGVTNIPADIDVVVADVIDYENDDKTNYRTWDDVDSAINKNLIVGVIDNEYIGGIEIPDTPVDLTGVNKRLDEIIEKLGGIIGSIGDINALTDAQLKEILKDLDLTNVDGLTIAQIRDYAAEKELAEEKEATSMFDMDNFKMQDGIIYKFPFSIPFDIYNVFVKLTSERECPVFEIPFKLNFLGHEFNETITIDMKRYDPVVKVIRILLTILFCVGLITITRDLIRG